MNIDELKTGDVVWVKSVVTDDGDLTITDTTDYEVAYIDRSDLEDMSPKDVILKGHAEQSPKYLKNIIAKMRELPEHDRGVWIKGIFEAMVFNPDRTFDLLLASHSALSKVLREEVTK
ncbi:TPA: hypothetical protein TVJ95_000881 [Streptococcus equi subsp. zooepidemicus]|nr:hypothetical protein [Streptococcus equi subsp. zooepidemicus]HEL1145942.1 hypothetical protein [Streptococcus equi subsp. zooepidemicus]HEL1199446.1 hypothetical protein [Streptococcus equi subsp. zooepidemicus]